MKTKGAQNSKVGIFVLSGVLFLVLTLYMIGKNRNLLGATFRIRAVVTNVNGLVPGNNVRFKGIDVGTVESIKVANDSAIYVTMLIDKKMKPFIRKNAIASIGTDGLMGNKLININSQPGPADLIVENDVIESRKPVETDEMLRTLNTTNDNMQRITSNLYEISVKLNSSENLWTLLSDSLLSQDLKSAVSHFKDAGSNTSRLTHRLDAVAREMQNGNGIAKQVFTDTSLTTTLQASLTQLRQASNKTSVMMDDLKHVVDDIQKGQGTAGLLLKDTALRQNLMKSAESIEQGTGRFNENMEALKSNFLFRRYFRKQEKAKKDKSKSSTE